jgi:AcrR family transcriptional regulator
MLCKRNFLQKDVAATVSSPPASADNAISAAKREAIIDIAAASFATYGFHGVSMRDIARVYDSSVATLYNHFISKDALLLAVGERCFGPFVNKLQDAATIPGDSRERFVEMLRVSLEEGLAHRNEFVALARDRHHIRMTPELRPLVDAVEGCIRLWYSVLQAGLEDGSVRPDLDAATTVWSAMCAVTGLIDSNSVIPLSGAPAVSPVSTLCTLFSQGLRPTA